MKSSLIRLLALLPLATAPSVPALAADSDWVVSDGGRMRIAALSQSNEGQVQALLDIEPAPGWKTYWRNPGDAGMPPEIDGAASKNLKIRSLAFPVPEFAEDADGRFIGYHGPVRILIDFDQPASAPSTLDAKILIGLCKDICLPVQGEFRLPVTSRTETEQESLTAAAALLPAAPAADFLVTATTPSADRTSVTFDIALPSEAKPEFALVPEPGLRFSHKVAVQQTGTALQLTVPVKKWPKDGKPAELTLLVKSGERAIETKIALP
ncbi:protein-disulfide reductase DsbD domain-containing protein [Rhizobium alvei]|uniref:Protein-disulfide reductase DsbD family protein n=1 Tax=Rhizobium alvei TaxID=1132659 RepID=A0ABT8YGL0_9HYPH|nr:protein-disulfide reductase DsbD domain-containing protein [Rhizobium alvei]MDO6962802.1 protein-disulfide reductase DsbD family protein [Rhizobium alvei]